MERFHRIAPTAARIALGLLFTVFGLNGFLRFLPMPPAPPSALMFMGALAATGYMLPLLKATEVAVGLLLLSGRAVPLALVVLAPVVVNIVAFHAFLAPSGMGIALFALTLGVYLAYHHRAAYRALFGASAKPVRAAHSRAVLSAA